MPMICYYMTTRLVEEPENLSGNMLPTSFLMIHNSSTGGEDNIANTSRRQKLVDPFLKIRQSNIEAWGDDAALIESAIELYDNLSRTMIVDFLKFANISLILALARKENVSRT
jgi:hypothetical protein